MQKPIVHIHVEKTGGVAITEGYKNTYGAGNVWGYSMEEGLFRPADTRFFNPSSPFQQGIKHFLFRHTPVLANLGQQIVNRDPRRKAYTPEQAAKVARVMTGHVTFEDMAKVASPEEFDYVSIVRDPLQRMQSHYKFLRQLSGSRPRHRVAIDGIDTMHFSDFAMDERLRNYQTQAIGRDLGAYALLGVVDHMTHFQQELGILPPTYEAPVINKGLDNTDTHLSPRARREFEAYHSDDYDLYRTVLEQQRSAV